MVWNYCRQRINNLVGKGLSISAWINVIHCNKILKLTIFSGFGKLRIEQPHCKQSKICSLCLKYMGCQRNKKLKRLSLKIIYILLKESIYVVRKHTAQDYCTSKLNAKASHT
jgi:hypothetical protein